MQRVRWAMFLCFTPVVLCSACTMRPFREEVASHEATDAKGISKVYIETKNGTIDVQCAKDAEQVDVEATRWASGRTPEDAKKRAEEVQVEVGRDGARPDVLRVVAKFPTVDASNRGASFRVTVPLGVSPELLTSNGTVSVAGADRDVHAVTSNGRVNMTDIRGGVHAVTSNGGIVARGIEGNVDVVSSNGAIDMERVGAAVIKAVTSNGRIRVVQARGSDVMLRSSNGTIELRLLSVPDTPAISVTTSNGDVTVELPHTIGAKLQMRTTNGRVDANLKDGMAKDFRSSRHSVTATLNDGAGSVDVESTNGSVTLQTSSGNP